MFSLSNILLHMVLKITVFFNISNVVIVYMEIFCCQNFVIKIVMLFHNTQGVEFQGLLYNIILLRTVIIRPESIMLA